MSIKITEVRNARSLRPDNLLMDVEIKHPVYGWIPYTVNPSDTDTTIDNQSIMGLVGSDFVAYVEPTPEELFKSKAAEVREERDYLLETLVDPVVTNVLRWDSLTPAVKEMWIQYRLDLLNISDQEGFPHSVTWPTKP